LRERAGPQTLKFIKRNLKYQCCAGYKRIDLAGTNGHGVTVT